MSLLPPMGAKIGQLWVDPITADWFVFRGVNPREINYGWVPCAKPLERENKGPYPEQAAMNDGEATPATKGAG